MVRYDVTVQRPGTLEQTLTQFFEPELAKWLLTEMEQNREKALAGKKVIIPLSSSVRYHFQCVHAFCICTLQRQPHFGDFLSDISCMVRRSILMASCLRRTVQL